MTVIVRLYCVLLHQHDTIYYVFCVYVTSCHATVRQDSTMMMMMMSCSGELVFTLASQQKLKGGYFEHILCQ